jgi:hypothetical protein
MGVGGAARGWTAAVIAAGLVVWGAAGMARAQTIEVVDFLAEVGGVQVPSATLPDFYWTTGWDCSETEGSFGCAMEREQADAFPTEIFLLVDSQCYFYTGCGTEPDGTPYCGSGAAWPSAHERIVFRAPQGAVIMSTQLVGFGSGWVVHGFASVLADFSCRVTASLSGPGVSLSYAGNVGPGSPSVDFQLTWPEDGTTLRLVPGADYTMDVSCATAIAAADGGYAYVENINDPPPGYGNAFAMPWLVYPAEAPAVTAGPTSSCGVGGATVFSVQNDGIGPFSYEWQWRPAGTDWTAWRDIVEGENNDPQTSAPLFMATDSSSASISLRNIPGAPTGPLEVRVTVHNGYGQGTSSAAAWTPLRCNCSPDFNGDGDIGTDTDIQDFFACLGGDCCPRCGSADFNGDGDLGTDADIEAFFRVLAGGSC